MSGKTSREKGFTFVELIIVMVIGSLVASAVVAAIFQLFLTTELNRDHITAYRQVQHAGYWVSRDAVSSQSITVDDDPATSDFINMTWLDWDGETHLTVYTLVDGSDGLKKLRRSYSVNSVVQQDTAVADYIDIATYTTTLSQNINAEDDTITVATTDDFPSEDVLHIENEYISYASKTDTTFAGCTRGIYGSSAAAHSNGAEVRCSPNTNCYWDGAALSLVITAQVGDQRAKRIYDAEPRPYQGAITPTPTPTGTPTPTPTPGPQTKTYTNDANVNIPYKDGWVYSPITVPSGENLTVTNVDVYVGIEHTYIGNLQVKVRHPDGTEYMLHDRTGGSSNDIYQWYSDITTFNGKDSQGEWRLYARDRAWWYTGRIDTWTLKITGSSP